MSVEKRSGRYVVRWRDTAGAQRSKTVALWRDAVSLDGEMKRKKAMGELVAHERGSICLNDFWEVWCRNYASHSITPRTLDVYARLWSKHVLPALGSRTRLRDVSRERVSAAVSGWSQTLAASSVRKVLAVLQCVLERAVEWQYIPMNPAKGQRKPRLVSRQGRALSSEEVRALIRELPDDRSRDVVRILALTGLRPGELRAITRRCVTQDSVIVERAVSRNMVGPTKTNRARRVPLSPSAHRAFSARILATNPGLDDFVIPSVSGRGVWTDTAWNLWAKRTFARAAARAGLKGLVPYDLRHTYVTSLIKAGTDPITVARQSGHSLAVCLSTYAHEFESERQLSDDHETRGTDSAVAGRTAWGTAAPASGPSAGVRRTV